MTHSLLCEWHPVHHPLWLGFLHWGEGLLQLGVDSLFLWLLSREEGAVALIRVKVK